MLIEIIQICTPEFVNAQPRATQKALKNVLDSAVGDKLEVSDAIGTMLLEQGFARERIKVRLLGKLKHKEIEYPAGEERDFDAELATLFLGNGTAERI